MRWACSASARVSARESRRQEFISSSQDFAPFNLPRSVLSETS